MACLARRSGPPEWEERVGLGMTASGVSDNKLNASSARLSRILVVDDEELIRLLVTEILGRMGCEVTTAADGGEAVVVLNRESFDLIITDLVMPVLDGGGGTS